MAKRESVHRKATDTSGYIKIFITPCDQYSVMNYCNKNHLQDGTLSPFDIIALQGLYGLPKGQASESQGELHLTINSFVINPQPKRKQFAREYRIFISGTAEKFDKISHVLYYLDPNWFISRECISKSRDANFAIVLKLRKPVYIVAFVFLKGKDGLDEIMLPYYCSFNPEEP